MTKGDGGKKTFSLGADAAELLETLADRFFGSNQTETVRAGLRALAVEYGLLGETTWSVDGYVAGRAPKGGARCYRCERRFQTGEFLYHLVFRRGAGPNALSRLPEEELWVCPFCVEEESDA